MSLTSNPESLRAGIIGAGFMGVTHSRAIRASGSRLVAAVGSSPERAEHAAHVTGAEQGLSSVENLLAREDIDVVHICTPNNTHESLAVTALKAGKAIVCEKPIAVTASSARLVVEAAEGAGKLGTVPFVYRFHPMVREMKHRIASGELGLPSVIHGSYLQDWLASSQASNWRVDAVQGGASRAFADIGSHWFDLFEFVTGYKVTKVSAQTLTVFPERAGNNNVDTEDAVSVHFGTDSGAVGTAVISQVAAGRKNRLHLEISGANSSFAFDQEDPEHLWLGTSIGGTNLARDPAQLSADASRLCLLPGGHPQGYQDAFNNFVNDSYSLISGSDSSETNSQVPTLQDGLRASVICDAVIQSAREDSAWIPI